jgi:hypothetical protein
LIGRQYGLVASVNAGRMSLTRLSGRPFNFAFIIHPLRQSKALCPAKRPPKKFSSADLLAHLTDHRFHVVEITLERAATSARQAVLGLGGTAIKCL